MFVIMINQGHDGDIPIQICETEELAQNTILTHNFYGEVINKIGSIDSRIEDEYAKYRSQSAPSGNSEINEIKTTIKTLSGVENSGEIIKSLRDRLAVLTTLVDSKRMNKDQFRDQYLNKLPDCDKEIFNIVVPDDFSYRGELYYEEIDGSDGVKVTPMNKTELNKMFKTNPFALKIIKRIRY